MTLCAYRAYRAYRLYRVTKKVPFSIINTFGTHRYAKLIGDHFTEAEKDRKTTFLPVVPGK